MSANEPRTASGTPKRPTWLSDSMFPFESRFISIEGNQLHYVDEGDGRPVLFLHGNPTWSFIHRRPIAALREKYRCIALDFPGFGLSRPRPGAPLTPPDHAEVVAAFVRELGLGGAILFGNDWSGPIGLYVAEQMPERFDGIMLGNTWAWPLTGSRGDEIFSKLMGSSFARFMNRSFNFFPRMVFSQGLKKRKLAPDVRDAYFRPFAERSARVAPIVFASQIVGAAKFLQQVEATVHRVADLPTLIVWPTADFAFKDSHRKRLEGMFPNHTSVTLEGCGHYIQEDAPEEVLEAIRSWLAATF